MKELKALTGLRAVAAIWVLFFHSSIGSLTFVPASVATILTAGYAAVSLFFVLSGFILTYNYFPMESSPQPHKRSSRYFVARFARIAPVYWLGFILGALSGGPWIFAANAQVFPLWLNVLTFFGLQSWTLAWDWINFPSWSVSCEIFFYATLPFLLHLLNRMNPKAAYVLLPIAAIVATAIGVIGTYHVASRSPFEYAVRFMPIFRWPEFVAGVLLGYLYKLGRTPKWIEAHGDLVATAGAILASIVIVAFHYYTFLHSGGLTIPFLLIIIGLAYASGTLYWILSNPLAITLGEASYSLYILQIPLKDFINKSWTAFTGEVDKPVWLRAVTFVAIIVCSVIVNKVFENPARRAILKFAHAGSVRGGASTA